MTKIKIDLNKFLKKQTQLDLEIHSARNLTTESTINKRQLGLIVELFEFINETKIFKYWSNSKPDKKKVLFEYVDILHFTLSLSLSYGIDISECIYEEEEQHDPVDLLNNFLDLSKNIFTLIQKDNFHKWIKKFIKLGSSMGLKFSEIEETYCEKLNINQQRQKNNY